MTALVNDKDLDTMLFYAFRYVLGRCTYAVSNVADLLIKHKHAMSHQTKVKIGEEILSALNTNSAGMEIDKRDWLEVLGAFNSD